MNHEQAAKEWDLVIEPQSSLFELHLKDVWRYRDLLWLLVKRDFVSFYKQTILGPLWFFIQPLFTTIIFTFIFGNLAGLSTDGLPHPCFIWRGLPLGITLPIASPKPVRCLETMLIYSVKYTSLV